MKYLFIALVALGLFATLAGADEFGESAWKKELQLNADGIIDYNLKSVWVAGSGTTTTTKKTLNDCYTTIISKWESGVFVDTLVFPAGCNIANSFWIFTCKDSLDLTSAATDIMTYETNGDTVFVKKATSAAGCRDGYAGIRVK